jgi:hypothetical protein
MNSKQNGFFSGIAVFLIFLMVYKIWKRAVSLGTTIFLLLVVFLMIYFLGHT